MATKYRLKRKTYGLVGTLVGEPLKGLGRGVKNLFTGTTGSLLAGGIGYALGGDSTLGKAIGTGLGLTVGKSVGQGVGNAVGKVGENISG